MKADLSVVMVTKNSESLLDQSLSSIKDLAEEIIIVDGHSTDKTLEIATKHKATVFQFEIENQGLKKNFCLQKTSCEWILILDSDELVSPELRIEIKRVLKNKGDLTAYYIPYNNHFLGHQIKYGGESYKILRLFKKDSIVIKPAVIHEKVEIISGKTGYLKNKIDHYSYRSLSQMFKKFTDYGIIMAQEKVNSGDRTNLIKIILYPLHMFWARFIEDQGYKDGFFRLPLDIGFAYMEFLSYFLMMFKRKTL